MNEQPKYQHIYSVLQHCDKRYARYGKTNHGREAASYVLKNKPRSTCDVGTGHGQFPRMMKRGHIKAVYGFDFALPFDEIDEPGFVLKQASADNLPLEDKSIDILTSFDMLEHIPEDLIDEVFTEFYRVCKRKMVFSISYQKSVHKVFGTSLHVTVRPKTWWLQKIKLNMQGASSCDLLGNKYIVVEL